MAVCLFLYLAHREETIATSTPRAKPTKPPAARKLAYLAICDLV